jgi:hypothetical protein
MQYARAPPPPPHTHTHSHIGKFHRKDSDLGSAAAGTATILDT